MASSIGSFPASLRRLFRAGLLVLGVLLAGTSAWATVPEYVHEALEKLNPEVPKGWAYTLATVRNEKDRMIARYDPSKPPETRWRLLELNGRPPTEKEIAQFARAGGGSTGPQASFQKADIEPATIALIRENTEQAEFSARFREAATGADKMLGHLFLHLSITKQPPHVTQCVLELTEPYSPVLWVKMRELRVTITFSAPTADRPALPLESTSHFLGRIFLIGMEENLRMTFSDFTRTD